MRAGLVFFVLLSLHLFYACHADDWRNEDVFEERTEIKAPFECGYESVWQEFTEYEISNYTVDNVSRSGAAQEDRERDYRPLRMHVSTEDLYDTTKFCAEEGGISYDFLGGTETCQESDILTREKRRAFLEMTIPDGKQKHESHLMVRRGLIPLRNSVCGLHNVPASHANPGLLNADFIAYVAVGKSEIAAWGGSCCIFQGRPGCARIFFNSYFGNWESNNVMVHQVGHAIGMGKGPYGEEVSLRDHPHLAVSSGKHARQQAAIQYNWSETFGLEFIGSKAFDESPSDSSESVKYSHWLGRNAAGEYMGCLGNCNYGILGLGVQRDLGFYRVRYDRAVFSPMAYKQGPQHHLNRCAIDGIPQADSFCGIENREYCHFDREEGFGTCSLQISEQAVPEYLQYFTDPMVIGASGNEGSLCPLITIVKKCKAGSSWSMPGSVGGPDGVCLNTNYSEQGSRLTVGSSEISALCAKVQCNVKEQTYVILFYGEKHYIPCPDLDVMNMSKYTEEFSDGELQCPPYYSVCGRIDWETTNAALPSALLRSARGLLVTGCLLISVILALV